MELQDRLERVQARELPQKSICELASILSRAILVCIQGLGLSQRTKLQANETQRADSLFPSLLPLLLPSVRPFARSLPSADVTSYYTPFLPSVPYASVSGSFTSSALGLGDLGRGLSEDVEALPGAREGNRGNKLKKGARWVRRGKAVAWGMGVGEREVSQSFSAFVTRVDGWEGREGRGRVR